MNKPMHELQKMGCGLLLGNTIDPDKLREEVYNGKVFVTNDQRMLAALKLCGFEVIPSSAEVFGIETFAKLIDN